MPQALACRLMGNGLWAYGLIAYRLIGSFPPFLRFPPRPKTRSDYHPGAWPVPPGPPRKSLKNQLVSGVVCPSILGPNMGLKMAQNRAPEAPKTLLDPRCCWKLFSEPCWAHVWSPGTSKIVLPLQREHDFQKSSLSPGEPKIEPKISPTSNPKRPPEVPRLPKN